MKKKLVFVCFVYLSICRLFAGNNDLFAGLDAYSRSDWSAAVQSFERALTTADPDSRIEVLYWLVMAETSAQNYQRALNYADAFLGNASTDERASEVSYQKGRLLHSSGDYEKSSYTLYQFIKDYPEHPKVPSAYYWIGENLYALGDYVSARKIFNDVVINYPQSGKVNEARYKIVLIDQQSVREELLRMASEANTSAGISEKISESGEATQKRNEEIVGRLVALEKKLDELSAMLAQIAEEQKNQQLREQQREQQETEQKQKEQEEAERQQVEKRRQELTELKDRTRTLEKLYEQRMKGAK